MTEYNITRKYESAYPAGRFDFSLNLIDGNTLLYRFFGNRPSFSIYKLLDKNEQKKVEALSKLCLESPDTTNDECVHIVDGDITKCYVISMSKIADEDAFYIELINITDSKNIINTLNERISLTRDYLTLQGEAVFSYVPDTNVFHMFVVNNTQNIELYNMDFDEWVSFVSKEKLISEDDFEIFETFCYILKKTTSSQNFSFHGSVLTDQNVVEKYKVSFTPRSYQNDKRVIIGTWAIINEYTNDSENDAFDAAHIDGLTGLLNKKAIMKYAENAVENADRTGNQVAIAVMDIDNFKSVNDNYGHLFGDKVIKAVGDIIKYAVGADAVAGRMGGDEFLIVFEKFTDELEYRNILRCIKIKVNYTYQNKFGSNNKLTCSIGLGRYGFGACSTSFHNLFKIADKALYLAKQKGKDRYVIYKPEIHGDFITPDDNGDDISNLSSKYYSEKDIDNLYTLLSDMVIYGYEVINDTLKQLSNVLMFDRIDIYLKDELINEYGSSCSNPDIIKNADYVATFNRNLLVINNINGIEYTLPDTYRMLSEEGISSLMQFLLTDRDGNVVGFITGEVLGRLATFPKIAITLFEIASRAINSILIREGRI